MSLILSKPLTSPSCFCSFHFEKLCFRIQTSKASVKAGRPPRQKARPPTKALLTGGSGLGTGTSELRDSYVESPLSVISVAQSTSLHIEAVAPGQRQSILSEVALQGLAAKENFASVRLQSMESQKRKRETSSLNPFNASPMLIMIKGRYHVQSRLVAPSVRSMNESDCFLLVSKSDVMVWKGSVSNIVEQNKAMEVAKQIVDRKDLGCEAKDFSVIQSGSEMSDEESLKKTFLNILNGKSPTSAS